MLYRRAALISSITVALLTGIWGIYFCMIREKDVLFYQNLMKEKAIATSNTNYSSTNQMRKGVRKDIWFAQDDDTRLQYRIESITSTLTLLPIKNKFEVVETLGKVKCWTQDKLYFNGNENEPMQQARYLEANEGIYHYSSQQFNAQGVSLSLFRIPGHHLATQSLDTKKAFLSGLAKSVTFTVSGKTPQFQAEQFKATLIKEESKTK
ncbi:MAG TPA: hypothetical protein VLG76_05835 [Rhabdochlamydiaceae bacterium]|nr:hypothetical protein [Rhabdochlamydiaceae bacterium]